MGKITIKGIVHPGLSVIDDGKEGGDESWSFHETRIGLHWPSTSSPGYFCLLGQGTKNLESNTPLRLLREGEEAIPSKLFERLCDVSGTFESREIFADLTEKFRGFVLNFATHKKGERPGQDIFLRQAPYYQEFSHGVSIIKDWIRRNSLIIPKGTIVAGQLGSITDDDLEKDPIEQFWAIDALRHVVSAFEVHVSRRVSPDLWKAPPVCAYT